MFSLEQLGYMSAQAAKTAAELKLEPYVIEQYDLDNMPPFPFPDIGTYIPKGWVKINEYFVDSSGFGSGDEPALTSAQFKHILVIGHGYAITEAGEFQVFVGEFVRLPNGGEA